MKAKMILSQKNNNNKIKLNIYTRSLTDNGLTYDCLTLQWCKSNTHSAGTIRHILNFDLFPGLAICCPFLS